MLFSDNKKQISPCVASKARYALGYNKGYNNKKHCTENYWNRVIRTLGEINNLSEEKIQKGIGMYNEIFKK